MSRKRAAANYGIIGDVKAKAVAVGEGARAVVTESSTVSRSEFESAMAALREQIGCLKLPAPSAEVIEKDIAKIEEIARDESNDKGGATEVLKGLVEKLTLVGVFLQTAGGLQEPIRKLAEWFRVPLPF